MTAEHADAVITTLSLHRGSGRRCLTRSVAVAFYCRMAGKWPTWRGVRYPPLESHAWIEADGRTVGEPGRLTATYTPTMTITVTVTVTNGTSPWPSPTTPSQPGSPPTPLNSATRVRSAPTRSPRPSPRSRGTLFINTIYNGDRIPVGEHPTEELLKGIYSGRS